MQIGSMIIENILSIKHAHVVFDDKGLILIKGYNFDDDTANGCGKTALMNALSFGIYGKFPRKITVSDLIRDGENKASVTVDNIVTSSGVWKVVRERPTNVTYYKDGIQQNISQVEFEKYIKLNYSQFLISMYSAQTNGEKFIDMNDTAKKDFLLKLMNLNDFSASKTIADNEIKAIQFQVQHAKVNEASLTSRIQVQSESCVNEEEIRKEIAAIELNMAKVNKAAEIAKNVAKPDISKFDELTKQITDRRLKDHKIQMELNSLRDQHNKIKYEHDTLKNMPLPGTDVTCPECAKILRSVHGELKRKSDLEAIRNTAQAKLDTLVQEGNRLAQQIASTTLTLEGSAAIDLDEQKLRQEKIACQEEYNNSQAYIAKCDLYLSQQANIINTHNAAIAGNKKRLEDIAESNAKLELIKETLEAKAKEIEVLQTVSHIYSPVGAPAYIMDSAIDAFNSAIDKYVNMIWPNASYSIQVFKENKNGDIKAKFSDKLIINGKPRAVGALSGGQHRCLSLAIDFAMIDILSSNFSIDINPVIFDEPLEGLDNTNKERVLEVLSRIAADRSIIIVEHSSEFKAFFSKTIDIELRDGISTIVS